MSMLIAALVLIFALALPLSNLLDILCQRDLEQNGQLTMARLGASVSCPSKVQPEAICHTLHYVIAGKSHNILTARQDLARGQSHQILYAPINPEYYRFADQALSSHWSDNLAQRLLISCSLSLVFFLVSLAVLNKSWGQFKTAQKRAQRGPFEPDQ